MSTTPGEENSLPEETPGESQQPDQAAMEPEESLDGIADKTVAEAGADQDPETPPLSLEEQLAESGQRLLRLQAELENNRKRAQRDLAEQRRYAALPLARDLLEVTDNLQRAIGAAVEAGESEGLTSGVQMVAEQLATILSQYDCLVIDAEGQVFDPNFHEAIGQVPSDDHPPGTIVQVTQAGYQMHDRVVRPSQVLLAASTTDPVENDTDASE